MWKNHKNLISTFVLLIATAVPSFAQEAKLIAVLKSAASVQEKSAACRQLARVATKQSVPVLASLLGDEKLSHMARYAMETISDPSVDEALRSALGELQGRPRLGVIGSLGVRRDAKAVDAIAKLLAGTDTETSQAAARALGNIGTPEAAQALEAAVTGASGANQLLVYEGLLRCAEAMPAQGQAIYDRLRGLTQAPPQVRAAALRGVILTGGTAGIPLMLEAIRGSDGALTAAAVRAAMELSKPEVTAALCDELVRLPADKRILLVTTLGYRGDASAGPALLVLASNGPTAVRLAAVHNLTHLGYAPALPMLAKLSLAGDSELAAAARTCLSNFPGKDADATILAMLEHKDAKVRSLAVQMIGQRNIAGSSSRVLRAAEDAEETVRLAAFKVLLHQASAADLSALLNLLVKARSAADVRAAESALSALCARESKSASGNIVDAICRTLPRARGEAKLALLRSLRTAGGPKALETIRAAMADNDPQVRDNVLHILCDWATPDALPQIIDLVASPPTPTIKVLALRGLVRLAPQSDEPEKFDVLKKAMAMADRDEERQLILSALGSVPSTEAIELAATHLDNPVLREEACVAAVTIAEKIPGSRDSSRVAAVMKKVAKLTTNKELAARANAVLGAAKDRPKNGASN